MVNIRRTMKIGVAKRGGEEWQNASGNIIKEITPKTVPRKKM